MLKQFMKKLYYWKRIFSAYIIGNPSQLSFWHNNPQLTLEVNYEELGPYYMLFKEKAVYDKFLDQDGIPMLNYHGKVGLHYNPIAIAQWGLGNFNIWLKDKNKVSYDKFILSADWLVSNIFQNDNGISVWMHHFDWEYRDTLKSPWYSGLAQGQGLSVLVRAYKITSDKKYISIAKKVFHSFQCEVDIGGVTFTDNNDNKWIEEYIVDPPTHILNGFIWALWGVYDYYLVTKDKSSYKLYNDYVRTLKINLNSYDIGLWSLYEHSGTRLKMISSSFYHKLHITQLNVMYNLTKEEIFQTYSKKWESYLGKPFNRCYSFLYKCLFKLIHY